MLNDIASNTSFFGIFITGVAYVLACAIQKRFKSSILNPLLVSCVILIIFMLVSGIDYNVYLYGKPKAALCGTRLCRWLRMRLLLSISRSARQ